MNRFHVISSATTLAVAFPLGQVEISLSNTDVSTPLDMTMVLH